jgi:hypothetical protein
MALAQFLSAVRVLIMDTEDLPNERSTRAALYRKLFPELSAEEIEDLSAVPPEKLGLYTSTIFHGERGMISNHFPCTLSMMKRSWEEAFGEPLHLYSFIREMHQAFPWKSNRTVDFAANFLQYLSSKKLSALLALESALLAMATLENSKLLIKRYPDEPVSSKDSLPKNEIAQMTVEELLKLHCVIPKSARLSSYEYDVVSTSHYFHTHNRSLPKHIEHRRVSAAGGRNRKLRPGFTELPEAICNILQDHPRATPFALEGLAEQFVTTAPPATSEEEVFSKFLSLILDLSDCGALVTMKTLEPVEYQTS